MHFTTLLTDVPVENTVEMTFQPENFVENLQYMGIGMLVIFAVIGIIALTTVLINKIFAD